MYQARKGIIRSRSRMVVQEICARLDWPDDTGERAADGQGRTGVAVESRTDLATHERIDRAPPTRQELPHQMTNLTVTPLGHLHLGEILMVSIVSRARTKPFISNSSGDSGHGRPSLPTTAASSITLQYCTGEGAGLCLHRLSFQGAGRYSRR